MFPALRSASQEVSSMLERGRTDSAKQLMLERGRTASAKQLTLTPSALDRLYGRT